MTRKYLELDPTTGRPTQHTPIVASAGSADAGKLVATDSSGLLDVSVIPSVLTNPMTTTGDIIIGSTGGAPDRLAVGAEAYILRVVSGLPAWSAEAGGSGDPGLTNPMTTYGDIIIGGAASAFLDDPTASFVGTTLLTVASDATVETIIPGCDITVTLIGTHVRVDATIKTSQYHPGWDKTHTLRIRRDYVGGTLLYTAATQTMSVDTGAGDNRTFTFSYTDTAPTTGEYVITIQSDDATPVYSLDQTMNVFVATTAGEPIRVGIGTADQVLTVVSGAPAWADSTGGGGGGGLSNTPPIFHMDPADADVDGSNNVNFLPAGNLTLNPGNAPLKVASVWNGKPVIRFDGSNDYVFTTLNINAAPSWSLVIVFAPKDTSTSGILEWSQVLRSSGPFFLIQRNGTDVKVYFDTGFRWTVAHTTDVPHVYVFVYDGAILSLSIDGTPQTPYKIADLIPTNTANGLAMMLGSGYNAYGQVDIGEVYMYGRILTATEQSDLVTALVAKYGI